MMAYLLWDDRTSERLADLGLDADAMAVMVQALEQSCRHLRDGVVPRAALLRFISADPLRSASALVDAGCLVEADHGWQVVDYSVPFGEGGWGQKSAEDVRGKQAASRISSERLRRHERGDHSMCERCKVVRARDASRDSHSAVSNDSVTASYSNPKPIRSDPRGSESESVEETDNVSTADRGADAGASDPVAAPRRDGLATSTSLTSSTFRPRPEAVATAAAQAAEARAALDNYGDGEFLDELPGRVVGQ